MEKNKNTRPGANINLSEETAAYLVLYRDANDLFNRIFETVKKYTNGRTDEEADKLFKPTFTEAYNQVTKGLLSMINNRIEWGLLDGKADEV